MTPAVQCCVGHSMGSASIHWLPDLAEINDQWDTMCNFVLREALLIVAVSASRVFHLLLVFWGFFPPFEMLILDQIIAEATLLMQISSSSSNCWLIPNYMSSIYCKSLLPRFFTLFFETLQNTKHNLHRMSLKNSYWTLARDSPHFAPSYNSYLTRIT